MVNIKIDGIETQVPENMTVLEAARTIGIDIPTFSYDIHIYIAIFEIYIEYYPAK